jgi:alkylation response protein AidB-like acyl-CoA dehydrogenase
MSDAQGFCDRVKGFALGPVAAGAPGWSMGDAPDRQLMREAAGIGLTGVTCPTEFGGQGLGFDALVRACESLAAVDFGFAMSLVNTHNVGLRLCRSAPDAIRDRYLPRILAGEITACTALTEPGAGSDLAAITTCATQTPEGWRITGHKTWIVNGRHAGLAVVFARCPDVAEGADGIGGFLVDLERSGVFRHPIESGFQQTSMGTGGFVLEDAPAECLLLPPGGAFRSILTEINAARCYVAAMCNAMLEAAITQAARHGAMRLSFGKPLAEHAAWRQPLGAAQTDLAASRALTSQAVALIQADADAQLAAAKAKIAAVEAAQRHIPQMLHAMGAEGLRPEHCFTRHLAAAQIAGFTDGATGILRDRVARLSLSRLDISER